jgi:hypothetical protein
MVTATRAGAVAQPTVAPKPKKTRAAPKATAAATSGVVKQPTKVKGNDGGKKPTKAQAAKIRKDKATEKARVKREEKFAEKAAKKTAAEADEEADEEEAAEQEAAEKKAAEKKAAEKETAEKTPDEEPEKPTKKSAKDKKKNKGDQAEPQDPDGDGDKDDDVPNPPGKPGQPGGGGDDDPAPDPTPPPPGGPGDDKGGRAAEPRTDAEILDSLYPELEERQQRRRRQLGPNEVLVPPTSSVTHEVEIFPAEIKYTAPGYDGTRLWLPRAGSARDGTTFTSAAFATAPYAFQYKDARWIKAHKDPIGSGSFGQAE